MGKKSIPINIAGCTLLTYDKEFAGIFDGFIDMIKIMGYDLKEDSQPFAQDERKKFSVILSQNNFSSSIQYRMTFHLNNNNINYITLTEVSFIPHQVPIQFQRPDLPNIRYIPTDLKNLLISRELSNILIKIIDIL